MRINKFSFGSITIEGEEYNEDVFVTNDSVEKKEGSHFIGNDVLDKVLINDPDFLIIGRGTNNMVKIPDEIRGILTKNNIKLIDGKTKNMIDEFNKLKAKNKVFGIFHLTC